MTDKNTRLRTSFVLGTIATGVALWLIGLTVLPSGDAPVATWHFGPDRTQVAPFDQVPTFDDMSVTVDLPWDGYVYVASFDHLQGTVGFFPSDYLGTDYLDKATNRMNAFSAGTHELPGEWEGERRQWYVPDAKETISLCVVVSREPMTDLESTLRLVRQMGNTAFPDKSMGLYMPRAGKDKLVGRDRLPHPALLAAQNQMDSVADGDMVPWTEHPSVFVKVLNIQPGQPRPGATMPGNPFQKQLNQMVDEKLRGQRTGSGKKKSDK